MRVPLTIILIIIGTQSLSAQSVNIQSLRINNEIPGILLIDSLTDFFEIDSTTTVPESMKWRTQADSLIYVGQSIFEYSSGTDICYLISVSFDDKVESVTIDDIIFNQNTTLSKLKSLFPTDCADSSVIDIDDTFEKDCACHIGTTDYNGTELALRILFIISYNQLVKIEILPG